MAAPRWYHEGIAVFVDTWMAGGLGRAQGGYDEMVFRVDGARRRAASTIRSASSSEGTKIDFQVEINSYLYGTRFMTWLAQHLLAREADRVGQRGRRAAAPTTPAQFRQRLRPLARATPGRDWIA